MRTLYPHLASWKTGALAMCANLRGASNCFGRPCTRPAFVIQHPPLRRLLDEPAVQRAPSFSALPHHHAHAPIANAWMLFRLYSSFPTHPSRFAAYPLEKPAQSPPPRRRLLVPL